MAAFDFPASPSNGDTVTVNGFTYSYNSTKTRWEAADSIEIVSDTSPQLGGNLDVNGNDIVSTSNGDIEIDPDGSGVLVLKGNSTKGAGQFKLNCENNSHGIVIKGPPHSAAASYTLTLPNDDGSASQVLSTDGSGVLSWSDVSESDTLDSVTDRGNTTTNDITVNSATVTVPSGGSSGFYGSSTNFGFEISDGGVGGKTIRINNNGTAIFSHNQVQDVIDLNADVEIDGKLSVGGSAIGSRDNSLSVVGDDNSSTIASKTTSYDTVFSVLPWSSSTTYLGTGIYYDDGNWVHASDNTTNSLLALTGDGVHWYASSGSATNFNVASNAPLWNSTGQWDGDINTTYDINTGSITSTGTGQFQAASGPVLFLKDTSGTGATNHNSWISFRDSGNTELGYVGYGSGSTTTFSVSNYSNGPVSLNGTAIVMGATVQIPDANTTISEGGNNSLRFSTDNGYVDVGPRNSSYCHFQTDMAKFYFNKPVYMNGGAVDYDTDDHFLLPNADNSASPNSSTARNGGAINYIYSLSSNTTLTRGDFAHHIIQQWSGSPTITITSSTFRRGDIIEFINVRGAVTITVVGTRIYLPTGSYDTTLTLSQKGKFRLIKYSTSAGYWMLG